MSSATAQNSRVTSVSYSFSVQWILKGKELRDLSEEGSNVTVALSDLYQFKTIKDLRFYLEIPKPCDRLYSPYILNIKGSKTWSFKLAYAFLVSKDKVYGLKKSNRLSFLESFKPSCVSDEDVAIHCLVNACPAHSAPSPKEDDLSIREGQNTVDFEDIPNFTLPSDYTNEDVIDFMAKGIIRNWTVDMARKIISETKDHECEVLKLLCAEYLMGNLTKLNFREILITAKNYGLSRVQNFCMELIMLDRVQIS